MPALWACFEWRHQLFLNAWSILQVPVKYDILFKFWAICAAFRQVFSATFVSFYTCRFIKKQGLDQTFHECETRMWRLGPRPLPDGIHIDGGSDWIVVNRRYVKYLVHSNDVLLLGLKQLFRYSLLPAEVSGLNWHSGLWWVFFFSQFACSFLGSFCLSLFVLLSWFCYALCKVISQHHCHCTNTEIQCCHATQRFQNALHLKAVWVDLNTFPIGCVDGAH